MSSRVCGGDTVKITSAPGQDPRILNWNDLEWTRNGPGLDLDLDCSLTIPVIAQSNVVCILNTELRNFFLISLNYGDTRINYFTDNQKPDS